MKEVTRQAIIGLGTMALVVFVLISFFGAKTNSSPSIISDSSLSLSSDSSLSTDSEIHPNGWTNPLHHSIPTKMSLQGKVTDFNNGLISDANLEVKISDANSCTSAVFYDYTFPHAVQSGYFNLLLGQNETLPLNFNQDYYMCLYVNTQLLSGPQVFRGGQGEVHSGELFDGNVDVPLTVNYFKVRKDLNVVENLNSTGNINIGNNGCGKIYYTDSNHTLTIQVNC